MQLVDEGWLYYAVRSAPQKEALCVRLLEERAFVPLLPTTSVERRKHYRSKATVRSERPVIAGYVFLGFPVGAVQRWDVVKKLHCVVSLVTLSGEPARVDYPALWRMCAPEDVRDMVFPAKGKRAAMKAHAYRKRYAAGESVRITSGVFAHQDAKVVDATDDEVVVTLGLIGREVQHTVAIERLAAKGVAA